VIRPIRLEITAPVLSFVVARVAKTVVGYASFREVFRAAIVHRGNTGPDTDTFTIEVPEGLGVGADTRIGPIRVIHQGGRVRVDLPMAWAAKLVGATKGDGFTSVFYDATPGVIYELGIGYPDVNSKIRIKVL
jgi:hypothetical protein